MTLPKNGAAFLLLIGLMIAPARSLTAAPQAPVLAPAARLAAGIRGSAVDGTAGALPGVAVVATGTDGRLLAETVTNAAGEFTFDGLPTGGVLLRFHLEGFADVTTTLTIPPVGAGRTSGEDDLRVVQRMELATLSESVVVHADPMVAPPPPPPSLVPVPDHDPAAVCAPAKLEGVTESFGTVVSRVREATRALFAPGDELLIEGGTRGGMTVGQNFVVRRHYRPLDQTPAEALTVGEHSAGLLQIVSADEDSSVAVVVYACDAMMAGDYLAAFQPEPLRTADPVGVPAFESAASILFADAGQLLGVTGRMMVIDHGTVDGVRPGQRLTLFRRPEQRHAAPLVVGEAIVVAARAHSASIHVKQATDAIYFGVGGDSAAPQGPPRRSKSDF